MSNKLREETDKFNNLLDEKLEVEEKLRLASKDFDEVKFKIEGQDKEISELKQEIDMKT